MRTTRHASHPASDQPGTKGPKKKKARQWQATVELPGRDAIEQSKPLVVRVEGRTRHLDRLDGIPLDKVEPARTFASHPTKRNKPNRPFLYGQNRHIAVESETEAIEAELADRDPSVQFIIPQGAWVKGLIRPLTAEHTCARWGWSCVDFLLGYRDGTVAAIEVKRHDYRFKPKPAAKLLATADTCAEVGLGYRLMAGLSRREWFTFYQLHNARRRRLLPDPEHDRLRELLERSAGTAPTTIGQLRALGSSAVTATLIWELVWHGTLCLDWTEPLTSHSPIRRHGLHCESASGSSAWDFVCGPSRENMLPALRQWAADST